MFPLIISRIYTTVQYEASSVYIAAVITAAMSVGLSLYACYTKTDFTVCGGFLFAMLLSFTAASILWSIFGTE